MDNEMKVLRENFFLALSVEEERDEFLRILYESIAEAEKKEKGWQQQRHSQQACEV